jgi:hypothetical protein
MTRPGQQFGLSLFLSSIVWLFKKPLNQTAIMKTDQSTWSVGDLSLPLDAQVGMGGFSKIIRKTSLF